MERQTGEKRVSAQKIWHIVGDKAVEVSLERQAEVCTVWAGWAMPAVPSPGERDTPEQQERLLLDDAIEVKGPKQTRAQQGDTEENTHQGATPRRRVKTEVLLLEKATGGFAYLRAALDREGQERVP